MCVDEFEIFSTFFGLIYFFAVQVQFDNQNAVINNCLAPIIFVNFERTCIYECIKVKEMNYLLFFHIVYILIRRF